MDLSPAVRRITCAKLGVTFLVIFRQYIHSDKNLERRRVSFQYADQQ
jgi:hypothetical protein